MSQVRSWAASHRVAAILVVFVSVAVLIAGFVGIARATDQPGFCAGTCHEMKPYHTAWSSGPHANVSCVECHVDPGVVDRVSHKAVAIKEVIAHVKGDVAFPLNEPADVPDSRCMSCHEDIASNTEGFDHSAHATRGTCASCHPNAGHEVSNAELKDAGVFNAAASSERAKESSAVAVVDGGSANIPGHLPVSCSNCHNMQATGCDSCHDPKHPAASSTKKTAECSTCHSAGAQFTFTHPTDAGECGACHTPPAKHTYEGTCTSCHSTPGAGWGFSHTDRAKCGECHKTPEKHRKGECATCHQPGDSWAFKHPNAKSTCTSCHNTPAKHRTSGCGSCHKTGESWKFAHPASANCTSCHNRPAGHRTGSCGSCHRSRTSWAFSHSGAGSSCTSCHNRPAKHSSASCTRCHATGTSWAFRHPGSGATCTSCHNRPSGHRSGACSSCHKTTSWKFVHTSSKSCGTCHKAPSGHYGSTCASCHSPSKSWSSATVAHPRIPGGEHTNKSFACSNCHPSGYSSHTCIKCHDSASGPN